MAMWMGCNMTKKTYSIFAALGAFIWGATVLLRGTALMDYPTIKHILWRTPNFATVWLVFGLVVILYPYIFKKEFHEAYTYFLVAAILLAQFVSEVVHLWIDASFDIWDMVAGITAALILIFTRFCLQKRRNHAR
jgi:membrane protein DedA with SNARE-associated domain